MKKPVLCGFLAVTATAIFALGIDLNGEESYVRCNSTGTDRIALEINIGSIGIAEGGRIEFPDQLRAHIIQESPFPLLSIHVAIAYKGEYGLETSEHNYQTGISYAQGDQTDGSVVTLSKAYRLRDLRGIDVLVRPLRISEGKLVIADKISIELLRITDSDLSLERGQPQKLNPYFVDIYRQHFINFRYRYEDIAEYGSMAVICPTTAYDAHTQRFRDLIQPWVDWKNQKGIPTTVYSASAAGDTYEEVRDFIQSLYDSDPNLTFVQLVGDYQHIPCNVATMYGNTGGMDAFYTLMEGDDGYPDIFVGRFSAETAGDLYTQIKRSIDYEKGSTSGTWMSKAAGVCSSNPPLPGDDDEHNWEHLDNIRTQLLDFGYTQVDRIYGNEDADGQDLIDCLNEGKSLVNYCGEGYPSHWVEPEFWIADAENLSNTNMLPFVHAVSCWTGQFYDGTCLAEALMRSRDPSAEEARGTIAIYTAAPEQGIDVPMEAQDHSMELLIDGSKRSIGGLCYNGACSMIEEYGTYGVYNFLAWNLFGDASLVLRTKPATAIDAVLPVELLPYTSVLDIDAGAADILVSLSRDNAFIASVFSDANGMAHLEITNPPMPGDEYLLTLSGLDQLPIQRILGCYAQGAHPVLELEVSDSGQFIEPETEINKSVRIRNNGSTAAENVTVYLNVSHLNQNVTAVTGEQVLGQILPGELKQTQLSFRISKGTPDLSIVRYSISIEPYGLNCEYSDVVHAPTIVLESVQRAPQVNWINPGDSFFVIYRLRNDGSAVLRELQGVLEPESEYLFVVQQDASLLSIDPGCADSLVICTSVSAGCPVYSTLASTLHLEAVNGIDEFWQQWKVTDPTRAVESFEYVNLHAFPWVYQSAQWTFATHSLDGIYSLCSQNVTADSVWLELSFNSRQAGDVFFCHDLYRNPGCADLWKCKLNQTELPDLIDSNFWNRVRISVSEGYNTLRWVGYRDPAGERFGSTLWLDMIEFPAGTVFSNARLLADLSQIEITLAPGEIRRLPIELASADGKYLHYNALIRNDDSDGAGRDGVRITCDQSSFTPGTEELMFFTLHNSTAPGSIRKAYISLPDNVLATLASSFSSPGQIALPFTGELGSFSRLIWEEDSGSDAPSLISAVRLLADANQQNLSLGYQIEYVDDSSTAALADGAIELAATGSGGCVSIEAPSGDIHDEETAELVLSANQNLMHGAQEAYTLRIYYNGNQVLSKPVTITYNSDPAGFYNEAHLSGYPNPLRDSITFAYSVAEFGATELVLYNVRGQKVRTLVAGDMAKGYYRSVWNATDDNGQKVGNGIYFCRLNSPAGLVKTIKCIVLR
jgi:gingipain R